jgi:flavin reductase (DIM6/NTAB) family NADH-FMN oxidoreductase RutF
MTTQISLSEIAPAEKQYWLNHLVGPRPIALASTVNRQGQVNLSPFSFFNVFSIEPPILVFSPSRRLRDGSVKHTLENILEVPEVVINMVSYAMVRQVSLASCEYARGVDEFVKSGLTKVAAHQVRPPLVAESPASFECRVLEVKTLGNGGGAGQLVIAEVLCIHVKEALLGPEGRVDARKLDLVARLGDNWYGRIREENLFEVEKPRRRAGIGLDQLPAHIRNSDTLTGNHLGQLAGASELPALDPGFLDDRLNALETYFSSLSKRKKIEEYAILLLEEGKLAEAWQVLLRAEVQASREPPV